MPHNASNLQSLTVVSRASAYDQGHQLNPCMDIVMAYPYDILTAACLLIIIASSSILLLLR